MTSSQSKHWSGNCRVCQTCSSSPVKQLCAMCYTLHIEMPKFGGASAPPSTHLSMADMPHILQFPKECLVFVDETGCAAKDQVRRKFGYSLRGEQTICHRQLVCGKSVCNRCNIVGWITWCGTTGTNSASNFADFVRGTLVPNMQPFNGHSKRSVAVMDNCSIHHVQFLMEIFREAGILVIFLPPYSP